MTIAEGDRVRYRIPRGQMFSRMAGICTINRFEKLKRSGEEIVYIQLHTTIHTHSPDKVNQYDDLEMRCGEREVEFAPLEADDDAFLPYMAPR